MAELAIHQGTNDQIYHLGLSLPMVSLTRSQSNVLNINVLPPELLSYIFVFGEQAERFTRTKRHPQHVRFPDLVSQVCRRWRTVALDDPVLWTRITIKHPGQREVATRYLDRSGPTNMLEIEIEMRSEFWNRVEISPTDWITQREYTYDLLEFLKTIGATPGRWRTLSIWARQPEPLFEVVGFLHRHITPALQYVSLKWASKSMQHNEESRALNGMEASLRSLVISGPSAPNLRHVELTSVPLPFVLERPSPLFTGLTSLSLTAATQLNSIAKLNTLLRGNPHLESLYLRSEPDELDTAYSNFLDRFSHTTCVPLPLLRSLSIKSAYSSDWILDTLKAIQAPNLETFVLATELYADYPGGTTDAELSLLNYLSGGSPNGGVGGPTGGSKTTSIYPLLRELDVSRVSCHSGGKTMMTLLSSFASVTCLSIVSHQTNCLGRLPWVLPKLEVLRLNGLPCSDLGNILRRRAALGHPISSMELQGYQSWNQEARYAFLSAVPEGIVVTECPELQGISDDDASEVDNWEDEIDDGLEAYFSTEDEWEGAEFNPSDNNLAHEDQEEHSQEEEEYQNSDGYSEALGDLHLPAPWIDEDIGLGDMYDFDDSGDPYAGYYDDFDLFATGVYFDGYYGYGEWEEDVAQFSEGSEGGYSDDHGYDDYNYDQDHGHYYGHDDYIDNLYNDDGDAYEVDF
ncbi:unnamed protein product [Rhizoctonia solani]|uniref:F-box domain-containing protein n=1 Tax=Rhizoctonia solani TaxID=456999 RepID=A0A8H2ZWG3_9AGAM|nr:unnamed protein product [Rhizoctonia solani]